jgi:ribosome biogenesis GTPase
MARREYDESDAKVRPNRRGSRPRTKIRPAHENAVPGTVIAVDRGRYTVQVDDAVVTAVKARELGRRGLVIGDFVGLVGDVSGRPDTLARIVRRDDTDTTERVIVANADQLAIVTALADPEPNPRMIDRCLVAAFDAGMTAVLVLTKADLASADDLRAAYEPLGVTVIETSVRREGGPESDPGFVRFREELHGITTVLVGYSGVGKSTLVNALLGEQRQATAEVREDDSRGRHTTTHRELFELPGGALLVDTPGIRALEVLGADEGVETAFDDVVEIAAGCRFSDCRHEGEPGCAVRAALAEGRLSEDRLSSHRKLERELARAAREGDPRARAEHRRTWKIISKSVNEHMQRTYGGEW